MSDGDGEGRAPRVTGDQLLRALVRAGFAVEYVRGSHHYLRRGGAAPTVTVPVHAGRTIPPGTLRSILRQADLAVDELRRYL